MLPVCEGTGIYFEVEPDKLLRFFSDFFFSLLFPISFMLHVPSSFKHVAYRKSCLGVTPLL